MSDSTQLALHPFSFIWQNEDEMTASEDRLEKLLDSLSRRFDAASDVLGGAVAHIPAAAGVAESFVEQIFGFTRSVASKLESDFHSSQQQGVGLEALKASEYASRQSGGDVERQAVFTQEYQGLTAALNFDNATAAQSAGQYMTSLRKAETVIDILREKAGAGLAAELAGPIDKFTDTLLASFPKIEPTFDSIIATAGDAFGIVGDAISGVIGAITKIIGWWQQLDGSTQSTIETVGGLIAVWYLLNSAFLASPIGMVLGLATAIGLLYDDYMKWQEGGESLIDWESWQPVLESASEMIGGLAKTIKKLGVDLGELLGIDFSKWSLQSIFEGLINNFNQLGQTLQKISKLINALKEGDWSEVMTIGRELVVSGATGMPAGKLAERAAGYLEKKATDFKGWLLGDERPAVQEKKPPALLSPKAVNNLATPDAGAMLLPGMTGGTGRYATSHDISQSSTSSVISPTITNKTDIVINGATDPVAVGNEVESRQTNVYSHLSQMYTPGVT